MSVLSDLTAACHRLLDDIEAEYKRATEPVNKPLSALATFVTTAAVVPSETPPAAVVTPPEVVATPPEVVTEPVVAPQTHAEALAADAALAAANAAQEAAPETSVATTDTTPTA